MFALTLLIAALYTGLTFRRETASLVRVHAKDIFVLFGTAAAYFVIGLVPLYVIYAPVLQLFPGRSFREYISFAPFPEDLINVSSWNALWAWAIDAVLA